MAGSRCTLSTNGREKTKPKRVKPKTGDGDARRVEDLTGRTAPELMWPNTEAVNASWAKALSEGAGPKRVSSTTDRLKTLPRRAIPTASTLKPMRARLRTKRGLPGLTKSQVRMEKAICMRDCSGSDKPREVTSNTGKITPNLATPTTNDELAGRVTTLGDELEPS